MKHYQDRYMITLYATAEIDVTNLDEHETIERIKLAIDAIREAISEIDKYEEERAKSAG